MNKEYLKSNKGISIADLIIAMIILVMFVGVIGTLYCQILTESNSIKLNSIAVYYSVNIAEYIDKISYNDVTNNLNNIIKDKFKIPDGINVTIDVKKYVDENPDKEDILKIINIKTECNALNNNEVFEFKKLKIKEF